MDDVSLRAARPPASRAAPATWRLAGSTPPSPSPMRADAVEPVLPAAHCRAPHVCTPRSHASMCPSQLASQKPAILICRLDRSALLCVIDGMPELRLPLLKLHRHVPFHYGNLMIFLVYNASRSLMSENYARRQTGIVAAGRTVLVVCSAAPAATYSSCFYLP